MAKVGRPKKFEAPQAGVYGDLIQSTEDKQPAEKEPVYRFNAKMPLECRDFLQEMAWRNRMSITDYLITIIREQMEAHPEWRDTLDILNKKDT